MSQENESITSIDQLAAALEAEDQPQDAEHAQPETEAQNDGQQDEPEQDVEQGQPVEGEGDQPNAESLDDKVVAWETAGGDKFEVPVAELKLGYMRDKDYRHQTQNFAREREQATQQIHQQFEFAQTYAQDLGVLQAVNSRIAALEQALPAVDRQSDPIGYIDVMSELQQLREHRTGVAGRVQQTEQQRQAETQAQRAQAQQRMVAELQTSIPGFSKELVGKLDATAQGYGFTTQELQAVADPRFVRILHDAMQFKSLQAKTPGAVNKVKAAPIKPAKQASTAVASGVEKQVKQFSKTKSLANFAALLQHTI